MITRTLYTELALDCGPTISRDIALGYGIPSHILDAWDRQVDTYRAQHHYLALGDVVLAARSIH